MPADDIAPSDAVTLAGTVLMAKLLFLWLKGDSKAHLRPNDVIQNHHQNIT